MDQTRKQARLQYADVPGTLIGTDGGGWDVLSTVLDLAAVALAAEQVGGSQEVLEAAVQYAKDRVQFGRQIGRASCRERVAISGGAVGRKAKEQRCRNRGAQ